MKDFEFYNPVRILFGKDQLEKLNDLVPEDSRVMLLYGGGSIKNNGVYDRVVAALNKRDIVEFGGIEPNPSYETCMRAVEMIDKENVDFLLAVGGGSVIDATKFIAAAHEYEDGDPWEILSKQKPVTGSLPIGTVLTLPATGTEMNSNSVISRQSTKEKFSFGSSFSFPLFSVLLPDAAGSLPVNQVANGVVDAFVHVIEQYLTYPVNAPLQDRMAESILITLVEEGPKVYGNAGDYSSMANLMWSASMALNGLLSCGVPGDWAIHVIGHELTALHNIDHARTLAIVLPGLWRVLKDEKKEKLLQYGERVWNITGDTDEERIERVIETTEGFFNSLGIGTRLGDYDVPASSIDTIVERFKARRWSGVGDRKLVTPTVVRQVLEDRL